MTQPNGRRLKLSELRAQGMEALKSEPGYEIELEDGKTTVTIPHPLLVDDDTQTAIAAADDAVSIAKAVLGDKHAAFIAGGGHSNDVALAWRLLQSEAEEAGPTLAK